MAPVPNRVKHIGRALRRRRQLLRHRRRSGRKPSIDSPYHRRGGPLARRRRATEAHVTSESTILDALAGHRIELPSWAFGNSGTRFKVFAQQGVPRDPYEKVADAAEVHRYTGVAPTVALHIPWDKVDDYADLGRHAASTAASRSGRSTRTRSRTTTTCSAASATRSARVRRKAIDHLLECVDIMDATGSRDLKLWFADGTNYPGQDDIRARQDRLAEALADRLRAPGRRPADGARVQAVRAVVLHDRRPRLGHRARALPGAGAEGAGRRRHRPPRARARTSSSSSRRCCAPASSARSTSTRGSTPTTT